ncbi:BTAD domain-containing putative transcriptional regulator [Streptomyces thermodiastaticus]|uniref:BTAD domain-containing putative transcriptional regulator n=1 Tax=Streptomyces thermodiastaticus TaxID=44061 RepID=UPI001E5EC530|nr:BTAD domain-containing putative transcriptional regulator [Streptomyces thermodiastaticus]MCE7550801.1 AAA family ATPase [Streptomyces thermodiastaticus]
MTQPPGYRLTVAPDAIDLFRFQAKVEKGRETLAAGKPEVAAQLLREALDLWRGPALADLAEAGIAWPELSAVQNARLDAMEDYFEAELALGRHQAVLGELETMVEDTALRERSCRQLMLALYRSGRQADALNVYSRVRSTLVEELGLEPGRELQELQRAILNHDPALNALDGARGSRGGHRQTPLIAHGKGPSPLTASRELPVADLDAHRPQPTTGKAPQGEEAHPAPVAVSDREPVAATVSVAPRRYATARTAPEPRTTRRRLVSVLLVRTQLHTGTVEGDSGAVDELLEDISRWVHRRIEHFGGVVTAAIGSVCMALFSAGDGRGGGDDAERAVLAALAVRDGLQTVTFPGTGPGTRGTLTFQASVATGEALLRYQPDDRDQPCSITGRLLSTCDLLLSRAQAGEIRACDSTRRATEAMIEYFAADDGGDEHHWKLLGIRRDYFGSLKVPTVEREYELSLVTDLLERARHRATPHLVTVLGDEGSGKTRFLAEFGRTIATRAQVARLTIDHAQGSTENGVFALQRQLVRALCRVEPSDAPSVAREKLVNTVTRLTDDEERVRRLLTCLIKFVDPEAAQHPLPATEDELGAWGRFLGRTTLERPLVLLIDDLHRADDALLDFVSGLSDFAGVPLLVVATARPELLRLRPEWGGGKRHVTTLTLEPLSDAAVDQLLDSLLRADPGDDDTKVTGHAKWFRRALRVTIGDREGDRRQYLRSLLSMHPPRTFNSGGTCWAAG